MNILMIRVVNFFIYIKIVFFYIKIVVIWNQIYCTVYFVDTCNNFGRVYTKYECVLIKIKQTI